MYYFHKAGHTLYFGTLTSIVETAFILIIEAGLNQFAIRNSQLSFVLAKR